MAGLMTRTTSRSGGSRSPVRYWMAGGVAACLGLALVSWVFLVGPQRAQAAERWSEHDSAYAANQALRTSIEALAVQYEQIGDRRAELEAKRQLVPVADELDALTVELNRAAESAGVHVESISALEPIDLAEATPVAPAPAADDADGADDADDADATSDADGETTGAPDEVSGASWPLSGIPVTIRVTGTREAVTTFLRVVQTEQPRALGITDLSIVPDVGGETFDDGVVLTVSAYVLVSPLPAAEPTTAPAASGA